MLLDGCFLYLGVVERGSGKQDKCQGHSGPILITTPNERLYTVRLSLYQAID